MATGFAFGGPDEQRGMLAAEGVAFDEEGRVIMEEFQWDGRPESATSGEGDVPTGPPPDFDWEAPSFRGRRLCARSPFGNGSPLTR